MSIRLVKGAAGDRVPLLVDAAGGIPDPFVAAYVTWRLRKNDLNTVRNQVQGISKCLAFCAADKVDLLARCRSGCLLTSGELERLAEYLKGKGECDLTTARPNFVAFTDYALWLAKQFINATSEAQERRGEAERERFVRGVEDWKPSVSISGKGPVVGLTEQERALFLSVIIPVHERNPFKDPLVKFRNFVLMSTSFVLGLRTGELLGLKLEDLKLERAEPLLEVKVRRRDPDDPRTWPADQKTRARTLPLSPELASAFQVLKNDRKKEPLARVAKKHKYMFINFDGAPLGHRGARGQYQRLREAVPELEGLINHRLRHDWNDRWLEMAMENGWEHAEMLRNQIYAMGWTINSRMTHTYGENARQKQGRARLLEFQRKAFGDR